MSIHYVVNLQNVDKKVWDAVDAVFEQFKSFLRQLYWEQYW